MPTKGESLLAGDMKESIHVPVMSAEVLEQLEIQPGQTVIDGTLGGGGHTRQFIEAVGLTGRVIAFDRDLDAIRRAEKELAGYPVQLIHGNFCNLADADPSVGVASASAVLLDLGLSSDQLADQSRGFSFHAAGPLDLRFDTTKGEPAWKLLQRLSDRHLADLIYEFGEERHSRRIARSIVAARQVRELKSATDIADIVRSAVPGARGKLDAATKTFQALRIAVNDELNSLGLALQRLPACLHAGTRIAIISFHSLEDRMVKVAFRQNPSFATMTRKPIRPSDMEVAKNPRCRSARLRVALVVHDLANH